MFPVFIVAGDVSGIEEASSAMIEGRISGITIAEYLGFAKTDEKKAVSKSLKPSLIHSVRECLPHATEARRLKNRGRHRYFTESSRKRICR